MNSIFCIGTPLGQKASWKKIKYDVSKCEENEQEILDAYASKMRKIMLEV